MELKLFQQREFLIESQHKMEKSMLYPRVGLLGFGTFIQPGIEFGTSKLNNIFIGRELRMKELKEEIEKLKKN